MRCGYTASVICAEHGYMVTIFVILITVIGLQRVYGQLW